jgi:Tol biopolymer transport system component
MQEIPTPVPTSIAMTAPPAKITATLKLQPTFTATMVPSATSSVKTADNIQYIGLTDLPKIPSDQQVNGTVVMVYPYWSGNRQVELLDLSTHATETLLRQGFTTYHVIVSPDHQWLAFTEVSGETGVDIKNSNSTQTAIEHEPTLVIFGADGHEHLRIAYQPGWGAISRWLPDNRLIIRRALTTGWYSSYTAKLVLNPFKGTIVELPSDPVDIYNLYPVYDWSGIGMISYSPSLTQRMYASNEPDIVLEDLLTHQKTSFMATMDSAPEWSPDGKLVLMSGALDYTSGSSSSELLVVNQQGEAQVLTNLNTIGLETYNANYTWSPDGQKIAFWVHAPNHQDYNHVNPAVLDVVSGNVTIFKIESRGNGLPTLIWSPDGRQLLMGLNWREGDQYREKTILVDLEKLWVVEIANGKMAVGWLAQ